MRVRRAEKPTPSGAKSQDKAARPCFDDCLATAFEISDKHHQEPCVQQYINHPWAIKRRNQNLNDRSNGNHSRDMHLDIDPERGIHETPPGVGTTSCSGMVERAAGELKVRANYRVSIQGLTTTNPVDFPSPARAWPAVSTPGRAEIFGVVDLGGARFFQRGEGPDVVGCVDRKVFMATLFISVSTKSQVNCLIYTEDAPADNHLLTMGSQVRVLFGEPNFHIVP